MIHRAVEFIATVIAVLLVAWVAIYFFLPQLLDRQWWDTTHVDRPTDVPAGNVPNVNPYRGY
jgi:hypothetical protein